MVTPNTMKLVEFFYSKSELGTKDIMELFECSRSAANLKKSKVKEAMRENRLCSLIPSSVSTEFAYEFWGIDIEKAEANYKKMKKLGLISRKIQERVQV